MSEKAKIIDFEPSEISPQDATLVQLDSGRELQLTAQGRDDLLDVRDAGGEMLLKIRLTDEGPVLSLSGTKLEMTSTESISLDAKQIEIKGTESTVVDSQGKLQLSSAEDIELRSEKDVRVTGEKIHLN